MPAGDDDVPILRYGRVQFLDNRTRVERAGSRRIGLGVRVLGGRGNLRGNLVTAPAATADAPFLEPAHNRLGGGLGIGLDMKVGGSQPLPQPARLGVDTYHLGVGKEVATLGRVVTEPGSGGDHKIAFGKQLAAEIRREGAGDIERKRVAVEQTLAE